MMLPPNIVAKIHVAKRNIIRGAEEWTVNGVPLIRKRTAPFGHTSAQAAHRLQYMLTCLTPPSPRSMAMNGQAFSQSPQETQRSGSVFSSKMLILLARAWTGPRGQKKEH